MALTLQYISSAASTADQTTYDFGNFSAGSDGLMIVVTGGRAATDRTVSSVSIGGTNGTIHVTSNANGNALVIASRVVSAGSQDVSVTFSAGVLRAWCSVYLLTGYSSTTPADTDAANNADTPPVGAAPSISQPTGSRCTCAEVSNGTGTAWMPPQKTLGRHVGIVFAVCVGA